MAGEVNVTIEPGPRKVTGEPGMRLTDVLQAAGVALQAVCGGKGTCGKCRVRLVSGSLQHPTQSEFDRLGKADLDNGVRLACQARLAAEHVHIQVSEDALLPDNDGLTEGRRLTTEPDPVTRVVSVELPEPGLEDQRADSVRLSETLGVPIGNNTDLIRALPSILRTSGFKVDAVLHEGAITAVLKPRANRPTLGVAADLGTTTIAAELLDLRTAKSLGTTATSNPQAVAGADVISRIEYIQSRPEGLSRLQKMALDAIDHLCETLLRNAGYRRRDVFEVLVAGNPTMLHILMGIDPSAIAVIPFTPAFRDPMMLHSERLGLGFSPGAILSCLPLVSGYVGADIIAGLLVLERMEGAELPAVFIDVGTNGEICLLTGSRILCCATAAGPAFEGAKISCGTRAIPGAVNRVRLSGGRMDVSTIQDAPPQGICGSGLIDAAAAMLEAGLLEPHGAIAERASVPEGMRHYLVNTAGGESGVQLARGVALTQRDIRELQLAKGAIQAGTNILLREAGLSPDDIARVYLGGAFGSFIGPESAVRIGLVPERFQPSILEFLGNTALAGAAGALLSKPARSKALELSRSVDYIELSGRPDFQMTFAEAMFFPAGVSK